MGAARRAAEPDESIVGTALREIRGETGLAVAAEGLMGVYRERDHPPGIEGGSPRRARP